MSNADALVESLVVLPDAPKADTNDRRTPRWFFDQCVARFGPFDLDVAANAANAMCADFIGPNGGNGDGLGALGVEWSSVNIGSAPRAITCWANPPYGPGGTIPKWIAKARHERDAWGTRTLMLLPADTSTAWYHDVVKTELTELVPFRLAFDAPDGSTKGNSAKFGSVLVYIAPQLRQPDTRRKAARGGLF